MAKTLVQNETTQSLKQKLVSVYEYLQNHGDNEQSVKIKQLARKLENQTFTIAFCGHFSAGKSTMINQVIGENILPSSPIPTSANLVKVQSGDDYAKVFFKQGKPRMYVAPYDYDLVKKYCRDGDQIEEIEISRSHSNLPPNTVIMDTPGIDSADDAHRIATESAIHLADLIFYVMDYNHVQAELNFLFTKELTKAGKDVYLVINQIDKHKAEELSFSDFQNSVEDSFTSWGVKPKRIFYTSLRQLDHPFNEFHDLQAFIAERMAAKDQFLVPSVYYSLKKITQDFLDQQSKTEEERLAKDLKILDELSNQEQTELFQNYQQVQTQLTNLRASENTEEKEFDQNLNQILKNAYLMPAQTRTLAESYLEACQPNFKVGVLFAKQKTEAEKEKRLEAFFQDIYEKTKSQLEWHVRDYLLSALKKSELDSGELMQLAQSFLIPVTQELLSKAIKPGARLSGAYLLQYTEDVADEIKKLARNQLQEFKDIFLTKQKEQKSKRIAQCESQLVQMDKYVKALTALDQYEKTITLQKKEMKELLTRIDTREVENDMLFHQEEVEYELVKSTGVSELVPDTKKSTRTGHVHPIEAVADSNKMTSQEHQVGDRLKYTAEVLQKAGGYIKEIPGFQKLAIELEEKAGRFANKGFTIALFGAFSAGKSSFANAMVGEKVLPVSPNPTTAAINKIKPVSDRYKHGTVLVKFKNPEVMLQDINRSLKVFNQHAEDISTTSEKISKIVLEKEHQGVQEKTHYSFLQAFVKGSSLIDSLGSILETDMKEFQDFVANEEKSCYVEWIELYYDCELTRKGITLVDTPGADSINARHTSVAFDYIKNSDAILFVTYFNHAFSKADREFLIQLGRVKESFQLDKMFFIINAIDLAKDADEKAAVEEYVSEQLVKYGIRYPHLYSLSSLQGLEEKNLDQTETASGFQSFETAFYQFVSNDLTEMAVASAETELHRVQATVQKLIESTKENQTAKEQKRTEYDRKKVTIKEILAVQKADTLKKRFVQEAEELVFYIKQRVFFRFNDFFKESFNPSNLRDDGRNLKKALNAALEEFLESIGYDFAQEMRATTLRLDRFLVRQLVDYQTSLERELLEIDEDLSFSVFEKQEISGVDFPLAFANLDQQLFAKALSYFKNPKSFFEKNGKKYMSEELYKILDPLADDYLERQSNRLINYYERELTIAFEQLISHMKEQVNDFYYSVMAALDGGISTEQLTYIAEQLVSSNDKLV